jgi:hypothetical protein
MMPNLTVSDLTDELKEQENERAEREAELASQREDQMP